MLTQTSAHNFRKFAHLQKWYLESAHEQETESHRQRKCPFTHPKMPKETVEGFEKRQKSRQAPKFCSSWLKASSAPA